MEGLETLVNLGYLNLSRNFIGEVTGLAKCTRLSNINLSFNNLGRSNGLGSVDALKGLLECPTIGTLDVSNNYLDDEEVIDEVFAKMPVLGVLYHKENGFQKKVQHCRKIVINACKELGHLNDMPVFESDRRCAEAFCRGGL